jgi:hypothetical protein
MEGDTGDGRACVGQLKVIGAVLAEGKLTKAICTSRKIWASVGDTIRLRDFASVVPLLKRKADGERDMLVERLRETRSKL